MCFLSVIGDWFEGSGWVEILIKANVSTPGRAESMLKGSQVKRCRYVHQITCAGLYVLLSDAFRSSSTCKSFQDWVEEQLSESTQFQYLFTVIQIEALLLKFVRSLRESNFELFVETLQELVPWMFALDHTHYARWFPSSSKTCRCRLLNIQRCTQSF